MHRGGSAAFSFLCSCLRCSALVLLHVSTEQMEPAEDDFCGIGSYDGSDTGGICKSGPDETFFGNIVENG